MTHSTTRSLLSLAATALLCTTLSGCAIATAGIKKGDERSFVRSMQDVNAGRAIEARMTRAMDFKLSGVDVEVAEGIVLLSGNVPTQKDKIEATRIAWSATDIEEVGNEIKIKGKQSFIRNTKDGVLEKSVRARLTADRLVKARNFNIETHDGIVYVMGVARTDMELKRAAQIAATTRGAKQVVSYARIADLPRETQLQMEAEAQYILNPTRDLPDYLTTTPTGPVATLPYAPQSSVPELQADRNQIQMAAPITNAPLSDPIPFDAPTGIAAAPSTIDMGERLGKELPTDEQLGSYRTGQAGEAVSIIESAPYYLDPDTGKEIPIRYDANGNMLPRIIR